MGPLRFLIFYLRLRHRRGARLCRQRAAIAGAPLVGASGAIAGVLAAYLMFRPCQKVAVFIPWFMLWLFVRPIVRIDALWVLGIVDRHAVLGGFHAVEGWRGLYGAYRRFAAGAVLFPLHALPRRAPVRMYPRWHRALGPICLRVRRSINVDRPMPPPLASRLS